MRLKVELFSTFQRKARRRTAHQCHTRPRQVAHAAPLPRRRAKQPGDSANGLLDRLCQGVFEASAVLKTRLVCFSPLSVGDRGGSASPRIAQSLQTGFCACVRMRRTFELSSKRIEKSCRYLCLNEGGMRERTCRGYAGKRCSSSTLLLDLDGENHHHHHHCLFREKLTEHRALLQQCPD